MSTKKVYSGATAILATGLGTAGNRYFNGDGTGSPTINATGGPTGGPCYEFAAAATQPFLATDLLPATTNTNGYVHLKFKFSALPVGSSAIFFDCVPNAANRMRFQVTTGGVLQAHLSGSSVQSGPTISTNTWYELEGQIDVSANPRTIRWRTAPVSTNVWTNHTNSSTAVAASTIYAAYIGIVSGPTSGYTVSMTDIIVGADTNTSVDWLSSGATRAVGILRPNRDGTHSFTAGDFGYDAAGANVATSDTTVYQSLDETDQTSLTDFIRQKVIRTTGYVEVGFASAAGIDPIAVGVTTTHHASSTGANQMGVRATDDGGSNVTTLWNNEDVSDTTAHYRQGMMTTKPSGGAWTLAALNALMVRLGYSGDVTDIPYFDSVSLEYVYTDVNVDVSGGHAAATGAAHNAAPKVAANAGNAAATAAALQPSVAVAMDASVNAGHASASVWASQGASSELDVDPPAVTATGEALTASASSATNAAHIATTAAAGTALPSVGTIAAIASVNASADAYDATVEIVQGALALAEFIDTTADTYDAAISIASPSEHVAATTSAYDAQASVATHAGAAAATVSAQVAAIAIAIHPELASAIAAAHPGAVALAVNAGLVSASAIAYDKRLPFNWDGSYVTVIPDDSPAALLTPDPSPTAVLT